MKLSKEFLAVVVMAMIMGAGIWIAWEIRGRQDKKMYKNLERIYQENSRVTTAEAVSVIKREFKVIYPHLDSLATASGIKVKHIERTTIIEHKIVYDTIPVKLTLDTTGKDNVVNMSANYECFTAKGTIDFSETGLHITNKELDKIRVTLTDVSVNDSLTNFYYFERAKVKILFLNLRIGRKHFFSETHSSCKGTIKTETINLIKR